MPNFNRKHICSRIHSTIDVLLLRNFYLIAERMTTDDDGPGPARDQPGDILTNYWLAKHRAIQYVSDSPVRTQPHFLQIEFFHSEIYGKLLQIYKSFLY